MYIRKLHIRNIRSYENVDIEFSPGINLILGANNSGKSTILRCLQKMQHSTYQLDQEDVRKTKNYSNIYIQISGIEEKEHSLFQYGTEKRYKTYPPNAGILFRRGIALNKTSNEECHLIDEVKWPMEYNDQNIYYRRQTGMNPEDPSKFSGFTDREDENNFLYSFLSRRKKQYYSSASGAQEAFLVTDDLRNLPSKIKNLTNGSHPFHDDFIRHCNDILGFRIGNVPSQQNVSEDKIGVFATKSDTIYLESMGEGVANILGILSVLLTEDNKLFLIEELENDIHPEALKKLLNFILAKSKNNQFIITTHSNIVLKYLATAENAKVFYTDMQPINNLPTSTIKELDNIPQDRLEALEKLGYDLFDFDLYKSYILFEESSAERIVRDFVIPEFVPELTNIVKTIGTKGVTTIENYYEDFLRLFVYLNGNSIYDKKVWVITDGDEAGKKTIEQLQKRFPNLPKDNLISFSTENFEEFYPDQFKTRFEEINLITDKKIKRDKKIELTNQVLNWITENRGKAKQDFEESAKEVIDILKNINSILKKK